MYKLKPFYQEEPTEIFWLISQPISKDISVHLPTTIWPFTMYKLKPSYQEEPTVNILADFSTNFKRYKCPLFFQLNTIGRPQTASSITLGTYKVCFSFKDRCVHKVLIYSPNFCSCYLPWDDKYSRKCFHIEFTDTAL